MAIAVAVEKGSYIYVYDEKNRQLCCIPRGSGPHDGLKGYTSSTVSVRRGAYIYNFDQIGRQKGAIPAA
jgi:hypothetical protein